MIINPFNINNLYVSDETEINVDTKGNESNIDFKLLEKYIINNYMNYLQNNLKQELMSKIHEYLYDTYSIKDNEKLMEVSDKIINKMFGYDILQKYIEDIEITDIRVVKYNSIYVKKKGNWIKTIDAFESDEIFEEYVRYCILKNNGNINYDTPIVVISDKKYNLRIEAGISPVNVNSPSLVIRIHRHNFNITLENLFVIDEMLDASSYKIISNAINNRCNIVISGKGGSGKTSLLRAIINKIPDEWAITINEESTELFIQGKNIIQREIIKNRENNKKITLQKLMEHSLVMSNDVIVVGELKGEETSYFIDAISTGHMGLATVHASSALNTLDRILVLFKRDIKNQQYNEVFVSKILATSIDYIIYIEDYKVKQIATVDFDKCNERLVIENIYER